MRSSQKTIRFAEAVNEALLQAMETDPSVILYGLGVDDPKGVFGTTLRLQERFGPLRVFDMPTAENAMTGIAVGAALNGIRPVMTHQRLDFFLLAMDQLVNNAAKWRYMFGGSGSVPLTIRLITGMGWGQGPTHSQNLQAWFAHIPGLKVVMPAFPEDAKGLLLSAIFDNNPVIYIEHRWLHFVEGKVPADPLRIPIGAARTVRSGTDVTVVSASYMTIEALHAVDFLAGCGIHCDLIDLRTISPLDSEAIIASVRKTGRLLALDTGHRTGSVAGEIIARAAMTCFDALKAPPKRLALPDFPVPTSYALTRGFYKNAENIAAAAARLMGTSVDTTKLKDRRGPHHDVPGDWFTGPF